MILQKNKNPGLPFDRNVKGVIVQPLGHGAQDQPQGSGVGAT